MSKFFLISVALLATSLAASAETYLVCDGTTRTTFGRNYAEERFSGEVTLILQEDHVSMSDFGDANYSQKGDQVWVWSRSIGNERSGLWNLNIVSGRLVLIKTNGGTLEDGGKVSEQLEYLCRKAKGTLID